MTYVSHGLVTDSRHKNVAFVLSVPYLLKYKTKFFFLKFGAEICEITLNLYMKHQMRPYCTIACHTRSLGTGPCRAIPRPTSPNLKWQGLHGQMTLRAMLVGPLMLERSEWWPKLKLVPCSSRLGIQCGADDPNPPRKKKKPLLLQNLKIQSSPTQKSTVKEERVISL